MLDVVPAIQTTGSYRRQDSCLFTVGEEPHRAGEWSGGERGVVERLGLPIDFNEEEGYFQRALEWHLLTNTDSCARLC